MIVLFLNLKFRTQQNEIENIGGKTPFGNRKKLIPSEMAKACLRISGMKGDEGHWGGEISIISQNFQNLLQYSSIHLNPTFPKQALKQTVKN
jgi:hypothetical protein